jgi:endoglucanase
MPAPYASKKLHVGSNSEYTELAERWKTSDPLGSRLMAAIAKHPNCDWIGEYGGKPGEAIDRMLDSSGDALRVFVLYAIPKRDLGSYSAGGMADAKAYRAWVDDIARAIGGRLCLGVLEVDALPMALDMEQEEERKIRCELVAYAVDKLTDAGMRCYIDAGDSAWEPAARMAPLLRAAGVERAAGVALNFAHTEYLADEVVFLQELRKETGLRNLRAIIDTSRAGRGRIRRCPGESSEVGWCNPKDRGVGERPTLRPHVSLVNAGVDALVWGKRVGSSDGPCRGGPKAGQLWPEYALELARNAIPPLLPYRDLVT